MFPNGSIYYDPVESDVQTILVESDVQYCTECDLWQPILYTVYNVHAGLEACCGGTLPDEEPLFLPSWRVYTMLDFRVLQGYF